MKKGRISIDYFLILLLIVSVCVCVLNYSKNTYLSGWDSLHPEFNLQLYWERITSVWQQQQGLGAPASQSHAAEIPRMGILTVLSIFLPQSMVRYGYIYLMIVLGPMGVFLLLKHIFVKIQKTSDHLFPSVSAFLGGLFYLLNYGSVQQFIAPFEMFATNYGYLGFIFLFAINYLESGLGKFLWGFVVVITFSSAMAHTATLWYVFYFGFTLYCISYAILSKKAGKRALVLILLAFALNCFWIFPNIYYAFTHGGNVILSKIHRLSSEETYAYNKKYGSINNYSLMKGYLTEWSVVANNFKSTRLLEVWENHFSQKIPNFLMYLFAAMTFLGFIVSAVKKTTHKTILAFIPPFLFASFFLLSNAPIISPLLESLRSMSSLFKEAIRSPYTKFAIYDIFFRSLFFAFFQFLLLMWIQKQLPQKLSSYLSRSYYLICTLCILYYALPTFQGQYINPLFRVTIPSSYTRLFEWARTKDRSARILELPFQSIYGWNYYKWETEQTSTLYQGAGFMWFGLPQPLIDREFDRWYQPNEQSYRELAYAINSQNAPLFEQTIQKYKISYILYDKSHTIIGSEYKMEEEKYQVTSEWLKSIPSIQLSERFGTIEIYTNKRIQDDEETTPINTMTQLPDIFPSYMSNYYDAAYVGFGDYFTRNNATQTTYMLPGRQLINQTERIDKSKILNTGNEIVVLNHNVESSYTYKNTTSIKQLIPSNQIEGEVTITQNADQYLGVYKYKTPLMNSGMSNIWFDLGSIHKTGYITLNGTIISNEIGTHQKINSQTPQFEVKTYSREALVAPNLQLQVGTFTLCSRPTGGEVFGADKIKDTVEIYANHGNICVDIIFNKQPTINLLNILSFDLQSNQNVEYCTNITDDDICTSYEPLSKGQNSIYIESTTASTQKMKIKLKASATDSIQTASFSKFGLQSYIETSNVNYSLNALVPSEKTTIKKQEMRIPLALATETFNVSNVSSIPTDCGVKKTKLMKRQKNEEMYYFQYQVNEGALCENIPFDSIQGDSSYMLIVRSKYQSGLPFRICFWDQEANTCIIDDELTKNKQFENDYFIIPSYPYLNKAKLVLRLHAVGEIDSNSQLESVSLVPFPYIQSQSVALSNYPIAYEAFESKKTTPILNYMYTPAWFYGIPSSNLEKNSTLIIDQAYEKNWVGFVSNFDLNSPLLKLFIPFLGTNYDSFHVIVNNWSNGWTNTNGNLSNNKYFYAVYLPQYYLLFGVCVFIGVVIIVSIHTYKKK